MITYSIIQKSQLEGALRLDAEYYQPEYSELNSKLKSQKSKLLGELAEDIIYGPFGSEILQEDYRKSGIPLIRVSDLNDWFVHDDDLVFIEESMSQEMKRYQVIDGDIVVSQRGTIAMFSRVTNRFSKWNISANLISIKKSENIDFDYLLVFLNSKYGADQLFRKLSGQVQPKITTDDVKSILILVPEEKVQKSISKLVKQVWQEQENSRSLYTQAENLLLEELGLKNFKLEDDLFYIINSYQINSAHRVDAEYFQPKYEKLISNVKAQISKLGDLVSFKKGIEIGSEQYQEEGRLFIRVSNLSKHGLVERDQKYLSEELYQKLKKDFEPKVGEILLTKDATPGIAYLLKEKIEGIIAGGILRLTLKTEIEPEYLALVINSIVGQAQVERDTGGSVIFHWRPEQIKNCLIPILPKPAQQKIADLVQKSHDARKKAKQLLEEAKRKVEKIVDKNYD